MSDTPPSQTDDAQALLGLATAARAEVLLPADAHVIGEPVAVTQIRYPGLSRAGLLATCRRGDLTYELSLADVVFPAASAGASLVARYRTWLGLAPFVSPSTEVARPHKVEGDDIVVGRPIDLMVLACKSNALRCRLLGSAREVTLRTAVRDEIPGSIITVTPRKQWTHARHPYLSGDVSSVRIDASVLGVVPLALHREHEPHDAAGRDAAEDGRPGCSWSSTPRFARRFSRAARSRSSSTPHAPMITAPSPRSCAGTSRRSGARCSRPGGS